MKRYPTIILRIAIFVAGLIVLAIGIGVSWFVIKGDTSVLTYILLGGICAASVPYFIALYQSFKLLGYIDTNFAFSEKSVRALKIITYSAFAEFVICTFAGLPYFYKVADVEDAPGFVIIGMAISGIAFIIFVFASVLNRLLQDAIAIKKENDLTI